VSQNQLRFDGMSELRAQLRNLPETLAGEASHIVEGAANGAAAEIPRNYPIRDTNLHPGPRRKSPWFPPGNLARGVRVTHFERGKVAAGAIVKSAAKHAHLFEFGTRQRRTNKGANRGVMPKAPASEAMIPVVIRARKRMYSQLADLLRRVGFQVEGV